VDWGRGEMCTTEVVKLVHIKLLSGEEFFDVVEDQVQLNGYRLYGENIQINDAAVAYIEPMITYKARKISDIRD
jgi:hypothetical protein